MAPTTTARVRPASSHRERGASLAEYALLVGLVASVCLGALRTMGGSSATSLSSASPAASVPTESGGGDDAVAKEVAQEAAQEADKYEAEQQEAEKQVAISAQADSDASAEAMASSVSLTSEDVGAIYWSAKDEQSALWETTVTIVNEWEGTVVLAVEITRTYADGRTEVTVEKDIKIAAGEKVLLSASDNPITLGKPTKGDVVTVSFLVLDVQGETAKGETLAAPGAGKPIIVDSPSFK